MQKAKLSWLFIVNVFLLITAVVSLTRPSLVQSALSSHLVISEVQIAGTGGATQDFVELYNPTDAVIELGDYRLVKRTATGSADTSLVAFQENDVIPAHGFFLWCNSSLNGTLGCDSSTAQTVANNNSVAIRLGAEDTGSVIDAVGLGTVTNGLGEGTSLTAPEAGSSVERKADSGSTAESMTSGADVNLGNGEDTDNNSADFILRTLSQPQNSSSAAEIPSAGPSPSASASATPSASPSASPSPSASVSPSVSPSPVVSPTPSASPSTTPSPSVSPSASPSASPTASSSASPSVSPSVTPSASASATPRPSVTPKPKKTLVCEFKPQTFKIAWLTITVRVLDCDWITK